MATQHHHHEKVRVVIDCSVEERAFIKMLAASKHMTISEYFLSLVRDELASKSKIPNKTTLKAHQETLDGGGTSYDSMEEFWADMGVKYVLGGIAVKTGSKRLTVSAGLNEVLSKIKS